MLYTEIFVGCDWGWALTYTCNGTEFGYLPAGGEEKEKGSIAGLSNETSKGKF